MVKHRKLSYHLADIRTTKDSNLLAWLAHFIEHHPRIHRVAIAIWKVFPPRVAGFLKELLTRNWMVGVVAVMLDERPSPSEIFFVKHAYRKTGTWGLPGGALEAVPENAISTDSDTIGDELIKSALRREIWEETGIEIETVELIRIDAVPYVPEEPGPYRLHFYFKCKPNQGFNALREGLKTGQVKPRSPEVAEIRMVPITHLSDYDLYSSDVRFLQRYLG